LAQESHCYDTFFDFISNIIDRVWRKFADVFTAIFATSIIWTITWIFYTRGTESSIYTGAIDH
jgi:hypothetical protein